MKNSILVLLFFIFFNCSDKDNTPLPLLNYIPENAFLIVKIQDHTAFKNTLENNDFLSDLAVSNTYKSILEKVQHLKYLSPKSESILALTETTANQFEFVFVTDQFEDLIDLDTIQNKTVESVAFANSTLEHYLIENIPFYSLSMHQKVIISSSKVLLEELDMNFAAQQPETLKKLYSITNKNKPASVFINMNNSSSLLSTLAEENSEIQVSGFSDWISLDLNTNQKNLNLSGVSIANDSTWNYIDLTFSPIPTQQPIFLLPSHLHKRKLFCHIPLTIT